jgi:hypothetical protein
MSNGVGQLPVEHTARSPTPPARVAGGDPPSRTIRTLTEFRLRQKIGVLFDLLLRKPPRESKTCSVHWPTSFR